MKHISGEILKDRTSAQGLNAFCQSHRPKPNHDCASVKPYGDLDFISLVAAAVHQMAVAIKGRQNMGETDRGEGPAFQTELDV